MNKESNISDATWEILVQAIEDAYGIQRLTITPTPDGSCLSDFPAYLGAQERLSELIGLPVKDGESLHEIAARIESSKTA